MRRPALYPPLVVLIVVGIALRAWAWIAFSPAIMNSADSQNYLLYAHTSVFSDVVRPAGYSLFLKVVGWVSGNLPEITILIQNLMGITTALIGFALVRRLGGPRWGAVIPAAVVLLSIDQIALEHQFMPETLFTLLVVTSAYAAARALVAAREAGALVRGAVAWLAAAGALLACAAAIRTVALVLIPFLVLWALFVLPRASLQARLVGAGGAAAAAVIVLLAYASAHEIKSGHFGLTRFSDWAVYIRTAQFADCSKFTPPEGTRALCEASPSEQRNGGDFYAWEPGSPARRLFGRPPFGSEQVGAFGRAAILNQPDAYLETVFNDSLRFYAPSYNADRPFSGPGPEVLDVNRRAPAQEAAISRELSRWYGDTTLTVRPNWAIGLNDLQQLLRTHGILLLQFTLVGLAGCFLTRGATRAGAVLLLGGGVLLLVVPAATALYNARYGIPAAPLLAAAAGLTAGALWQRIPSGDRAPARAPRLAADE